MTPFGLEEEGDSQRGARRWVPTSSSGLPRNAATTCCGRPKRPAPSLPPRSKRGATGGGAAGFDSRTGAKRLMASRGLFRDRAECDL